MLESLAEINTSKITYPDFLFALHYESDDSSPEIVRTCKVVNALKLYMEGTPASQLFSIRTVTKKASTKSKKSNVDIIGSPYFAARVYLTYRCRAKDICTFVDSDLATGPHSIEIDADLESRKDHIDDFYNKVIEGLIDISLGIDNSEEPKFFKYPQLDFKGMSVCYIPLSEGNTIQEKKLYLLQKSNEIRQMLEKDLPTFFNVLVLRQLCFYCEGVIQKPSIRAIDQSSTDGETE